MTTDLISAARTFLFVPGDRPDRFARALSSGADAVIVDLEDAVADAAKDVARAAVVSLLEGPPPPVPVVVRINAPATPAGDADLAALGASGGRADAIVVPKADLASDVARVSAHCGAPVIALVETAAGLHDAAALAMEPTVVRLALGSLDLCAELGLDPTDSNALSHARFTLLVASARAGVAAPIDGPSTALKQPGAVAREARLAAAAGFTAKLCIHPDQLPAAAEAFRPTREQLAWARHIVASSVGGATQVDGQMVDRPVLLRAEQILARADTPSNEPHPPEEP